MAPPLGPLFDRALCALRDNLLLQAHETLVVAYDGTVSERLHSAIRMAARSLGAPHVSVVYDPIAYRPIGSYGLFAGRSLGPPLRVPAPLLAAITSADAFVLLCSDTELLFSPDLPELLAEGRRGLFLPYFDEYNFSRILFTTPEEVHEQAALIDAVGEMLDGNVEAHVTSAEGTDLRLRLGEYPTLRRRGITGPGQLLFLPAGNVARVPNDGTANGTLVVDRTICADDYKELHEPIVLQVERGQVTSVEGGTEARLLARLLEKLQDPRVRHLTELAVGTNPLCQLSGVGAPSEDTHVIGTIAFALGCDIHVGGSTVAPCHIDMTMRFPSLTVGDREVVRDGTLMVAAEQ